METPSPRRPASKHRAYVLRTCAADLTARGGFQWPEKGYVAAPDWDPAPRCGGGLHGLLWGEGPGSLLDFSPDAKWLVVEVDARTVLDLGGKVKFPHGWVMFVGDRKGATDEIRRLGARGPVVGAFVTAGDRGTATAGDRGTAAAGDRGTATAGNGGKAASGFRGTSTAGDYGTATARGGGTATAGYGGTAAVGYGGTATAGDYGTATAGHGGKATAGNGGTATAGAGGKATAGAGGKATAGDGGTATAGYGGKATAGDGGTATAGDFGTATAGDYGTATAGEGGTATAGEFGTVSAGEKGTLRLEYYDTAADRYRTAVAYVGEKVPGETGPLVIEPNQPYRVKVRPDGTPYWVPVS